MSAVSSSERMLLPCGGRCWRYTVTPYPEDEDAKEELQGALCSAASLGHQECVDFALRKGAQINKLCHHPSVCDQTALHAAVWRCDKILMKSLIENHGAFVDVRQDKHQGNTPLIEAVQAHIYDMVELLLKYGASVNAVNRDHQSATNCALRLGDNDVRILRCLIHFGANINCILFEKVRLQWYNKDEYDQVVCLEKCKLITVLHGGQLDPETLEYDSQQKAMVLAQTRRRSLKHICRKWIRCHLLEIHPNMACVNYLAREVPTEVQNFLLTGDDNFSELAKSLEDEIFQNIGTSFRLRKESNSSWD